MWTNAIGRPYSVKMGSCEVQRESIEFEHLKEQAFKDWEKGSKEKVWPIDARIYDLRKEIAKDLMTTDELKPMIQYAYVSDDNIMIQYRPYSVKAPTQAENKNISHLFFVVLVFLSLLAITIKYKFSRK